MNSRVIVLGGTGMLGQAVTRTFSNAGMEHSVYSRVKGDSNFFEYRNQTPDQIAASVDATDGAYIINCIGWIPQRAVGENVTDVKLARELNVELPRALEDLSRLRDIKVLQITTDCVFDGRLGSYVETDEPNSHDIYGISKSEGESRQPSAMRFRCSIIGKDLRSNVGLYSWYESQPADGEVVGFENHIWNGVTTDALSKLFLGVIKNNAFSSGVQHWIPGDSVSKYQLLCLFRDALAPAGAAVRRGAGETEVDRTLSTNCHAKSNDLWALAGYHHVPSIKELVYEMVHG